MLLALWMCGPVGVPFLLVRDVNFSGDTRESHSALAVLQEHYLANFDMGNALVFVIYRRGVLVESVQELMSTAVTIEPFPSLFSVVRGWM